jgi:hypothetical protein
MQQNNGDVRTHGNSPSINDREIITVELHKRKIMLDDGKRYLIFYTFSPSGDKS